MSKITGDSEGLSFILDGFKNTLPPDQQIREVNKNSEEAIQRVQRDDPNYKGLITFEMDKEYFSKNGVAKLCIIDNGDGMAYKFLDEYLIKLGASTRKNKYIRSIIEIVKPLAIRAINILEELQINNVYARWGDGYNGWPSEAPFDCIIVTAAPDNIPEALIKQLKIGGKLVIPVGKYWQELKVISKTSDSNIHEKTIIPVRFVPMVHPSNSFFDEDLN